MKETNIFLDMKCNSSQLKIACENAIKALNEFKHAYERFNNPYNRFRRWIYRKFNYYFYILGRGNN